MSSAITFMYLQILPVDITGSILRFKQRLGNTNSIRQSRE